MDGDRSSDGGRLADNIVHFGRLLRRAGLRVGPAAITDAVEAVTVAGVGSRNDFYWTLHSVLVNRHEDHAVFDEAFQLFWRSRELSEKMIAMFSPTVPDPRERERRAGQTRVAEALTEGGDNRRPPKELTEIELDARFTSSVSEVLRKQDFGQMTTAELAEAKRALGQLVLPFDHVATRRFRPSSRPGRIDSRATMRAAFRTGGDLILPRFRKPKLVQPPLVVLADISGSMSQYTRIFLHFLHVLTEKRRRVHTFLFGTRLSNVTRQMRNRDPDEAIEQCSDFVRDWSGGTRIAETLRAFNHQWSRRVLSQGATVLLITDGLERDTGDDLSDQMERLHKSCRRLIWLNPLLRFSGFEARASGVRIMLPHVDELRAVHNLDAITDLVAALDGRSTSGADPRRFLISKAA